MSIKSAPEQVRAICEYFRCIKSFSEESGIKKAFFEEKKEEEKYLVDERFRCEHCVWESSDKQSYLKPL